MQFLPLPQPPLAFADRSYRDLPSWHWDPWLQRCPSRFLSTYVYRDHPFPSLHLCAPLHIFTPLCISTLPSLWMNVASLTPWLLDFHTAWFSDNSGWYLFCGVAVFFAILVHRGDACFTYASVYCYVFLFLKYILLIMVLQFSQFLPFSPCCYVFLTLHYFMVILNITIK